MRATPLDFCTQYRSSEQRMRRLVCAYAQSSLRLRFSQRMDVVEDQNPTSRVAGYVRRPLVKMKLLVNT